MDWVTIAFWLIGTVIVMLGPILLIHELAHFILAKMAGVSVEEFGFGFPPRLIGLWRGEGRLRVDGTRVTVPRGFKLPAGLERGDRVAAITRTGDEGHVLQRVTLLAADESETKQERGQVDEAPRITGTVTEVDPGTLYSLNLLPMGAFVKMTGEEDPSDPRSLGAQSKRWRLAVMAAGPVINLLAALLLLVGAYASGLPTEWRVKITDVAPGTAAARAGLQADDLILAADGERISEGLDELHQIIRAAPEETIELEVKRGRQELSILATPERRGEDGFLGIMMAPWPADTGLERYSIAEAVRESGRDLGSIARMTLQLPVMLLRGEVSSQEARPTSVVGITQIMTFSLQQSVEWRLPFPALQTMSLISLALGLTNLLPLPALDGGRILFVILEAIRGRRISPEREAVVHFIGMMILVALMLLVMLQDFLDPIIPWSLLQ